MFFYGDKNTHNDSEYNCRPKYLLSPSALINQWFNYLLCRVFAIITVDVPFTAITLTIIIWYHTTSVVVIIVLDIQMPL